MQAGSRSLVLMRHAKAESFAANDHERPLSPEGRRDAEQVGRHLAGLGVVPDNAVVSSAKRAVESWHAVAAATGAAAHVDVDDALYQGSVQMLLEVLRTVREDARVLMMVGHNPSLASLVHLLDDGRGEESVVTPMLQGYPAGATTVLQVRLPWHALGPERARIVDFHTPA